MNRTQKIFLWFVFVLLIQAAPGFAQEQDTEGCKDHPMFSRMKNFYIVHCDSNYDAVEFIVGQDETKLVEGQKTLNEYTLVENATNPSPFQIRKNFSNAIKSLGGTVLFEDGWYVCGKIAKNNREVWVSVQVYNDGWDYSLIVLEAGEMEQEVMASDMQEALDRDGFMALYINFDTGKSDIRPESQPIIDQIVQLLKDNPGLNLSIEGHTDNVGSPQNNKILSENRAKSVMNAVASQGIAASRLSAVGWGQERPVADNRTEEGRAKNRRVEIVKK